MPTEFWACVRKRSPAPSGGGNRGGLVWGMRILFTVVVAVIASAPQAFAQSSELPRALIGVSVARAETDASARMRLGSDARPWIYSAEFSARVAPRLAIGAEAIDFGIATGATSGRTFRSEGEQRERALMGLLRVRAAGSERFALDVGGGGGVLFQRHIAATTSCIISCTETFTTELTARSPAFFIGVDVPVRIARHLWIAGLGRYYFLNRGDHTSTDPRAPVTWQFEYVSSRKFAVGASARVHW
jgi:hypothetical protein